jgi:hypothetical protein
MKTPRDAGRALVSGDGFSLTFARKGVKNERLDRHDPAAVTRVPVSRNH